MSYVITSNDFANDMYVMRGARLLLLSRNIADNLDGLDLPDELSNWAVNAYDNWNEASGKLVDMLAVEEMFRIAQVATAALKAKYQATKNLLKTRYLSPDDLEIYGIAGRTPVKRHELLARARDMANAHRRFSDMGDPNILPDAMIDAVAALADDVETKHDDAYFQKDRGHKASIAVRAHYNRDTAMLRTLYRWCVAKWGRDNPKLIAIGFRDRGGAEDGVES